VAEVPSVPSLEQSAPRNQETRSFTKAEHARNDFSTAILINDIGVVESEFSLKPTFKIMSWLAGATLLVALAVSVSLWTFRQIEGAAGVRKHTSSVINSAVGFMSALKDAETGQRGYILSGDEAYLDPYLAQRDGIETRLEELKQKGKTLTCTSMIYRQGKKLQGLDRGILLSRQ